MEGIANILAAIKTARYFDLTEQDLIVTVATDSSGLYDSERDKTVAADFSGDFDAVAAGETYARHLIGVDGDHYIETGHRERRRIFNLGYFTWVEQQGKTHEEIQAQWDDRDYWNHVPDAVECLDKLIDEFNDRTGLVTV